MTWLLHVLLIEYAALGLLGLAALVQRARERAAWRRLALHVWTRAPMSTTPPTMIGGFGPEWVTRPDGS